MPEWLRRHPELQPIQASNAVELLREVRSRHVDRNPAVDALYAFLRSRPTYQMPVTHLTGAADLAAYLKNRYSRRFVATHIPTGNKTYHATRDPSLKAFYDWATPYVPKHVADMCVFVIEHPRHKTPSYATLAHHNYHIHDFDGVVDPDPRWFRGHRQISTFMQFVNFEPEVDFFTRHVLEDARDTFDIGFTSRRMHINIGGEFPLPRLPHHGGDPWLETAIPLKPRELTWERGYRVYGIEGVQVVESNPTEIDIPFIGTIRMTVHPTHDTP